MKFVAIAVAAACGLLATETMAFGLTSRQAVVRPSTTTTLGHPSFSALPQKQKSTSVLKVAMGMPVPNSGSDEETEKKVGLWPCGDDLDKRLLKIAIPMVMTFMITPLMGAVDLFWVNRMGNALAVAGQAASNQVYNTAFWLASFLPSGTYK